MPKMKTKRGAAKRFRPTGTGKVKMKKQGLRHILTKKSQKRKRNMRKAGIVNASDMANVKACLPYMAKM